MKSYIAEDNVRSTGVFPSRDEAYESFIEEFGMEPTRIIDVTGGHSEARIVWTN